MSRPPLQMSAEVSAMIVHGAVLDSCPETVECDDVTRFKDGPYVEDTETLGTTANLSTVALLFCVDAAGSSLAIVVKGWKPWIRYECPPSMTAKEAQSIAEQIRSRLPQIARGGVEYDIQRLKRFYGFEADATGEAAVRAYLRVRFNRLADSWSFKRLAESFPSLKLVDTQVKPFAQFLNDCALTPSSWITASRVEWFSVSLQRMTNCQGECAVHYKNLTADPLRADIAPLLIASIDGEMYSHDGAFPSVDKGDFTICIGISLVAYGRPDIKRTVFCLGDAILPEDAAEVELRTFASRRDLFEGFRDFLVREDPDVITGWNTFGFDFSFMFADYSSLFDPSEERGTEAIQLAAAACARNVLGLSPESVKHPLARVLHQTSPDLVRKWSQTAEKKFGSAFRTLLKESKALSNAGSACLIAEDSDEDRQDEHHGMSGGLRANSALLMRKSLCGGATATLPRSLNSLCMGVDDVKLSEIWSRVQSSLSPSVATMLRAPPASGPRRGLFLSRITSEKCQLIEKRMSSAARGDNVYSFIDMTGRILVDLMQVVKDDKKPDDNSLKYAASHWLGADDAKIDMSVAAMFRAYESRDPLQMGVLANYCARDCDIPLRLIENLSYIPTWVGQSRVCFTQISEVVNSGQQVKVFNLISRFVWGEYALNNGDSGWPCNADNDDDDDSSRRKPDYQGATVIEPEVGFYEDCISTLDFASLYPSIIRFFNLCPSVLISSKQNIGANVKVESHAIVHNIYDPFTKTYKEETRQYSFATHVQGVIPRLLKRLLDARSDVKKQMGTTKDPLLKAVLNGRQNGIKLACNSVYGFFGVSQKRGMMPCKPIAAVTTLKGRAFIDAAKKYVETTYPGSRVVYGDTDSVMIKWGAGTDVARAAQLGEEAAKSITRVLRSGELVDIGGAGALNLVNAAGGVGAGAATSIRDLAEACSAVTLAYEKTYQPYLLLKKKNYVGIIREKGGVFTEEMDMKGIDAVRRDRPKIVREASNEILEALMRERSVQAALASLSTFLKKVASGQLSLDYYVLSKSIRSTYASSNLPHVRARERMIGRGEEAPPIGSRMPYAIFVDAGGGGGKASKSRLYERAEHPSFAARGRIDHAYYVESLENPLTKLLQFVVPLADLKALFRAATDAAKEKSCGSISLIGDVRGDGVANVIAGGSKVGKKRPREQGGASMSLNIL